MKTLWKLVKAGELMRSNCVVNEWRKSARNDEVFKYRGFTMFRVWRTDDIVGVVVFNLGLRVPISENGVYSMVCYLPDWVNRYACN